MPRTILVGLDGSEESATATRLGIKWARHSQAMLVGIGVIDEPTIARSAPVMLGGAPYADPVIYRQRMGDANRQVTQFLEQFALACSKAKVPCKVLEDAGLPSAQILLEAQRYDLILLGSRTRFHFEIQDRVDETLTRVIRDSPGPVVAVPEIIQDGDSTVIAFDGSLQAARALHAFVASGLANSSPVHVVSVGEDKVEVAVRAERAIDFLRFHEIKAHSHPISTAEAPAKAILRVVKELNAGLLVAGAYGQPALREFLLGSVTRTMLKESTVPLFLFH